MIFVCGIYVEDSIYFMLYGALFFIYYYSMKRCIHNCKKYTYAKKCTENFSNNWDIYCMYCN